MLVHVQRNPKLIRSCTAALDGSIYSSVICLHASKRIHAARMLNSKLLFFDILHPAVGCCCCCGPSTTGADCDWNHIELLDIFPEAPNIYFLPSSVIIIQKVRKTKFILPLITSSGWIELSGRLKSSCHRQIGCVCLGNCCWADGLCRIIYSWTISVWHIMRCLCNCNYTDRILSLHLAGRTQYPVDYYTADCPCCMCTYYSLLYVVCWMGNRQLGPPTAGRSRIDRWQPH